MCHIDNPRLFGISFSNKDFRTKDSWGKNQFNSSFPTALGCYMFSKKLPAKYITMSDNFESSIGEINIENLYNIDPLSEKVFYAFETQYTPYQRYYIGSLPRTDLVVQDNDGKCLSGLEIKLTALPDQTTFNLNDNKYGSEVVVRPDTIVYLACSILDMYSENLKELYDILSSIEQKISDWSHAKNVIEHIEEIICLFKEIVKSKHENQKPILIQPIWKTVGKSPNLSDHCLDMFVWSNFGLFNLFISKNTQRITSINRHTRTVIWLYKMLLDGSRDGHFNGSFIIDELSYNTKNDKAFATSGVITHKTMQCQELTNPRILKDEIKNIILGGGQNLLSPERRFDAIISNSPDLFID